MDFEDMGEFHIFTFPGTFKLLTAISMFRGHGMGHGIIVLAFQARCAGRRYATLRCLHVELSCRCPSLRSEKPYHLKECVEYRWSDAFNQWEPLSIVVALTSACEAAWLAKALLVKRCQNTQCNFARPTCKLLPAGYKLISQTSVAHTIDCATGKKLC
eukprot:4503334-Pleurochrysis_carterae.AAC.1